MRSFFHIVFVLFFAFAGFSQVPNGNFEAWQTVDMIENPSQWETNNFYIPFSPIEKVTTEAIQGDFSLKISSTARDFYGSGSWPGFARVKFVPTEIFQYLTASIRIDSIKQGEIDIRVKQRGSDGFYHKIGGWKQSTVTNGAIAIWFPVEYTELDTLAIEIWAFNRDQVFGGPNYGYAGAIIDNLALSNTVATKDVDAVVDADWSVFPNPSTGLVTVEASQLPLGPIKIRLLDLQGRIWSEQKLDNGGIQFDGLAPGLFIVEISVEGMVVERQKLVVVKS